MNPPARMTPEIELLETEEKFVETLKFLVTNVRQPLESWLTEVTLSLDQDPTRREKNSMYNIIKKENIDVITILFANIKQILDINTFILEKLREAKGERIEIVKKFKSVAPTLKFYADYIRNFESARQLLKRLMQDLRFASFIRAIELQPFSRGHAIESHLAKPWQRVMKYELLLKEIKKGVDDEEEKELISKLILDMKLINHGMNRSQAATENQKLLMEKQKTYGLSDLTKPARYFVKDGDMKVIKDGRKKDFSFILCNDALFWGKKQGIIHYASFREYDMSTLHVVRKGVDESRSFYLLLSSEESIQVECSSVTECEEWLCEFISLKTDDHLETFTGRKDSRRLSVPAPSSVTEPGLGGRLMKLFEFVSIDEGGDGSCSGEFFNNTYEIPLAARVNADHLGYIPYDALVKVDEHTTGERERDRDEMVVSVTSDSVDSVRIAEGEGQQQDSQLHCEEHSEPLQVIAGGLHTVNIAADLLAEALSSSPSPAKAPPLAKGASLHQILPPSSSDTEAKSRPPLLTSQSEASLLQRPLSTQRPANPASTASTPLQPPILSSPHVTSLPSGPASSSPSHTPAPRPLPFGWEQKRAPDGRLYYVHHATKTTQWERPFTTS